MTSAYFGSPRGLVSYCNTYPCYLDTVEVWGSSPHGPTISFNGLASTTSSGRAPNGSINDAADSAYSQSATQRFLEPDLTRKLSLFVDLP